MAGSRRTVNQFGHKRAGIGKTEDARVSLHNGSRGLWRAQAGAGRGAIDARLGGVSRAARERHGGAPKPRGGPAALAARVGRHARCGMRQRRARRAGPR